MVDVAGTAPTAAPPAPASWSVAVQTEGLGIQFLINRRRKARVRDLLLHGRRHLPTDAFWAVRDVTISVRQGEAVGLVGHNGSGKSTLLKMIAGVLLPDEGTVTVNGGVAPLLELGAGFSPDLSARENIALAGSIHGLSRQAMDERFDDIVTFAGVRRFLDTPMKHYSSGMKVRLGFAITAQLDHPIMLIDEVLAVGDKAFRRKCYDKIDEMLANGRTLMVVSHRDAHIRRFCERALYLREGRLLLDGSTEEVFERYAADADQLS
ncbi:MAG: ABC transporter ATP-binding protein [Actinomycetota bacterium]|nr:ABC transporter ATP-binding protein [Actinomycetota bacterium]